MKRTNGIVWLAAIFFFIAPAFAFAQTGGNIQIGNLKIIPGVTVEQWYDDNIYLGNGTNETTEQKKADWITHIKPALLLNYTMPERGAVNLGYQGDFAFYNSQRDNNWKNHKGMADMDYKAPAGLILGLKEQYQRSEDPYGSADQYALGRVTKRWDNDLRTKVGWQLGESFRTLVYYNFYRQEYDDLADFSQNYGSNEFGVGAEARFLPRTWGFLRYHYGVKDYNTYFGGTTSTNDSDSKWHRVNAGISWDPGAKLSGELNVGYQWKKFDNQFTSTGTKREDRNTWIAETSVTYTPFTTTSLSLNLARAVRDTASDTNEYFDDTGIGISLKQGIFTKFNLNAGVNYSKNEYNLPVGNNRKDDNYQANVGLDYEIQPWLGVGIGYDYRKKNSNDSTFDFTDNRFMASIKVVY